MIKLLYYQETLYNYTRLKSIELDNDNNKTIFIFVELSITKEQHLGDTRRQQIITVFSELIKKPLKQVPQSYIDLPEGDLFLDLDKETFERLQLLIEHELVAFVTYNPNQK